MRLWLNRSGEIPLRNQLNLQIVLGILCGELLPGYRLPSTRELARRFGIHANTASAAYRQLEKEGWLEFRHGSGVFVRATQPAKPVSSELAAQQAARLSVDQLIGDLVVKSRELNISPSVLRERLQVWLAMEPPSRWLIIEPEPELRSILLFELQSSLRLPIAVCSPEECKTPGLLEGAMPLALPSRVQLIRGLLPPELPLTVLHVHPVAPSLQSYLPAPIGALIGVTSRWKRFQHIARTMLVAAGIPPESLLIRDATRPGWKRGLEQAIAIVCDAAIESNLPKTRYTIVFRLIAEASIAELHATEASLSTGPAHAALPV